MQTPVKKDFKRNALGKGLGALLSGNDASPVAEQQSSARAGTINLIPIDKIETNPFQPRTHFDIVALEELADSIRVQGIIQPITVRSMGDGSYQLISGERRLQASRLAGLKEIPAYVRTANDEQMLEMALIENIQREDLNPIEVSIAYKRLIEELGITQEMVGEKVGKKRSTVTNYLRLLKLPPEIQLGLKEGKITMGHARALINLENVEQQLALYHQALNRDLSVREVERMVAAFLEPRRPAKQTEKTGSQDVHLRDVERKIAQTLGSKVSLQAGKGGKGEIRIQFNNHDDLDRIMEFFQIV